MSYEFVVIVANTVALKLQMFVGQHDVLKIIKRATRECELTKDGARVKS